MWDAIQAPFPGMEIPADEDPEQDRVLRHLLALDPGGQRIASALRRTIDLLLDGRHTGRYRWDQLHKTEKTHAGTLVEIGLQREFGFADGAVLDYSIAGAEVDCKFSQRVGGWMIPPEAFGMLLLLVSASDEQGRWCAGLVRARSQHLRTAPNRDLKRGLNEAGTGAIRWLHLRAPLAENALLRLPTRTVAGILALPSGQQRVNELFRRAQGRRITRAVIATVAQQDDYMKRVRAGGGARDQLRGEGIVILGGYGSHRETAAALGLPAPGPGEFVSARLVRRRGSGSSGEGANSANSNAADAANAANGSDGGSRGNDGNGGNRGNGRPWVRLGDGEWMVAEPTDPVEPAPRLPDV